MENKTLEDIKSEVANEWYNKSYNEMLIENIDDDPKEINDLVIEVSERYASRKVAEREREIVEGLEDIMKDLYLQWCKETKRSGSVLVGSSIKEFFKWVKLNGFHLIKNLKK